MLTGCCFFHEYYCFFLGKPTNTPCDFNSLTVFVSLPSFKKKGKESMTVILSITNINYPAIWYNCKRNINGQMQKAVSQGAASVYQ